MAQINTGKDILTNRILKGLIVIKRGRQELKSMLALMLHLERQVQHFLILLSNFHISVGNPATASEKGVPLDLNMIRQFFCLSALAHLKLTNQILTAGCTR